MKDHAQLSSTTRDFHVNEEVQQALESGEPVVALESTIITHGMPFPRNLETALGAQQAARRSGAVPATVAILNGRISVGLSDYQLEQLASAGTAASKCSTRDIPFLTSSGSTAGTTVAATLFIAARCGIAIFATGGIGGVHRGANLNFDVSADLQALSAISMGVVCAGPKSVLDIGMTLEYLETHGVPVVGYRTDTLPAFYTRNSGFPVDYRLDSVTEIAQVLHNKWALGLNGATIIANPAPAQSALDETFIAGIIEDAVAAAASAGISGKALTPYLLQRIQDLTKGQSLNTNIQLMFNNAAVAGEIAVAVAAAKGTES